MKPTRWLFCLPLLLVSLGQNVFAAKSSSKDARVTIIVHDVNLLPNQADARPAAVNDRVAEDTGVRTGDQSRSELTFTDLTITRLGANSVYNYNHAGRSVDLGGGSVLLRVPKDSGGASVRAPAVSVAVTGTIFILEAQRSGRSKLIVLEGGARLALRKYPKQTRNVRAGQMLDVPAGATTLSEPVNIDANQVMKTHPLIVGFPPLPSQGVITAGKPNEPVYQGQQVGPGAPSGGIGLGGFPIPVGVFGGGGTRGSGNVGTVGGTPGKGGQNSVKGQKAPSRLKATPSPTPGIQ